MRKKLTLTEELNRIKGLMVYENGDYINPIIKEENGDTPPKFTEKIDFAPGWYTIDGKYVNPQKTIPVELGKSLQKLKEFLLKNPEGYLLDVVLEAGESQIPNADNTPNGGGKRVIPGFLSEKRLITIEDYILNVFNEWKKDGINTENIKIKKCYGKNCGKNPTDAVGKTKWVGQDFCPSTTKDPYTCSKLYRSKIKSNDQKVLELRKKYNEEQYVRVTMGVNKKKGGGGQEEDIEPFTEYIGGITPIPVTEGCLTGLKIKLFTYSHSCNIAEFFIVANNTVLKNTSGGITHNGNDGSSTGQLSDGTKLSAKVLNPGYGKIGTTKYGTDGDIKGERFDEFIITSEQSKQIISQTKNNKLVIYAICTTKSCHSTQVEATITHPKREKNVFGPKRLKGDKNILAVLSPCGDAITTSNSKKSLISTFAQPNTESEFNQLKTERLKIQNSIKGGGGSEVKSEEGYKSKLLTRISTTETYTDRIIDAIERQVDRIENKYSDKSLDYKYEKLNDFLNDYFDRYGKGEEYLDKAKNELQQKPYLFGGITKGKKYDYSIGDIKMNLFDDNLHKDKNEMFTDIKRKLTKIYSVLNQVIQSDEMVEYFGGDRYMGNSSLIDVSKIYNTFKGKPKKVGDLVQNF